MEPMSIRPHKLQSCATQPVSPEYKVKDMEQKRGRRGDREKIQQATEGRNRIMTVKYNFSRQSLNTHGVSAGGQGKSAFCSTHLQFCWSKSLW